MHFGLDAKILAVQPRDAPMNPTDEGVDLHVPRGLSCLLPAPGADS
ncbi:hypothetical protein FraEuI1c_2755 [Pseudofrankia inefficax]|uniref:Uncharacterized protein n=1 Tax=Pseudofrankia inefficax (strain DSM 45817 / CECT 9037 / DDB 130130 / EuI1c) TaxID=298654 RepID=E3J6K7_PSEI1|nr:hypothetical protein FraEuI1c_2755 [Pseudofrankia inefficax]